MSTLDKRERVVLHQVHSNTNGASLQIRGVDYSDSIGSLDFNIADDLRNDLSPKAPTLFTWQ